jgi:A/G-specific adenine glycosylase
VRKRPSDGLNGGLWEFPNTELKRGVPRRSSLKQCLPDNESYELTPLKTVRHSITRYRITLEGFRAESGTAKIPNNPRSKRTPKARARLGDGLSTRWLSLKQLQGLAFTAAHRKLLEALLEAT